jgi:NADPH:quinone reductase-like Zn-dependent oxidoreductase
MVFDGFGGPDKMVLREWPLPNPKWGEVRIEVKAFGINRAEIHMRRGDWGEVAPVTGIECVGTVDLDPSGILPNGQKVACIVGGMGRTRNGSYADFTCVETKNVFTLHTSLAWDRLAAVPESYATAWTCLFDNLKLTARQVLLVRGGTSALGQAAINIAVDHGATVLASTRVKNKISLLHSLGASEVFVEDGFISKPVLENYPKGIDSVLDIVGNSVLRDSLRMLRKGSHLCQAGFLGGGQPIDSFNPLADLPSGVYLSFFGSGLVLGTERYPVSAIPMQEIVDRVSSGIYKADPVRVFPFNQIPDAHRFMEANQANGKIVVVT